MILAAVFLILYFFTSVFPFSPNRAAPEQSSRPDRTEDREDTSPSPSPSPTQAPSAGGLRGDGGEVRVTRETEFEFTPDTSGIWEFFTSDNGDADPFLEIFDSYGYKAAYDDDSGGNMNAHIQIELFAGQKYKILAGFYDDDSGSFLLTARLVAGGQEPPVTDPPATDPPTTQAPERPIMEVPGEGGSVLIRGETVVAFIPAYSEYWEIFTSNNNDCDPFLELTDARGNILAADDDGMGDLNARLLLQLNAGETYFVNAKFYGDYDGEYTLTIRPGEVQAIPDAGGTVHVNGGTMLPFTPNRTGIWEFYTTNNGDSDPYIVIYAPDYDLLADDDDSGEGYNAFLTVELIEGEMYFVNVWFYSEDEACDLVVTFR